MVAFYLPGGLPVYSFSLLIGIGAALGISGVAWQAPRKGRLQSIQASIGTLFGALVGGRMAYVAVQWSYYRQHLPQVFQIYQGGLAWPGALAGGLLIAMVYARHLRKQPGALLWTLFPLLTSMIVFTWLACWGEGCAYGSINHGSLGLLALDEWGNRAFRFPTQFVGALAALLWFIALDIQNARHLSSNLAGWIGLLGTAIILFGLTYLRADPGIFWHGLRLDAWAALGFTIFALGGGLGSLR